MVEGHEGGNWLGPTILANVTMDMDVWHEEIFAPVLVCLEVRAVQRFWRVTAPVGGGLMQCMTCMTSRHAWIRDLCCTADANGEMSGFSVPAITVPSVSISAGCADRNRLRVTTKLIERLSPVAVNERRAGCAQADSLDVALEIVNSNTHGNGTAIFTRSGSAARKFQNEVQVMFAPALWCA